MSDQGDAAGHISAEFRPPQAPWIHGDALPEEERGVARYLAGRLHDLQAFADDYVEAVALHGIFSQGGADVSDRDGAAWSRVALRDGAMSLYHIGKSLSETNVRRDQSPILSSLLNAKTQRRARRRFEERFPTIEQLRHSLAHASELTNSAEKAAARAVQTPGGGTLVITNGIINGLFTMTFNGALVQYDPRPQSVLDVNDIIREFFSAFSEVARY